jgi:internalin A
LSGLGYNQITDLTPLRELKSLRVLFLGGNRITDIKPLRELKNLELLDVKENRIEKLPPEILTWWTKLGIRWEKYSDKGLNIKDNPLTDPPIEIVKQGTAAVKNYLAEMTEASVLFLESKVLLVGSGDVGKTTLMKKLKDNNFVVVPGKEDTTRGFDYWLNAVKLFGAGSPLIMVMNKAALRLKHIDEASFQDKFPNIARFLQVSCLTGQHIPELTETIRMAFSRMPHLLDKLPKRWMDIRDELKARPGNYLSQDDYFDVCASHRMEQNKALFLSDYLHDLGIILHFRHDPVWAGTVILKPE